MPIPNPGRRQVLSGAGLLSLGGLLAACGGQGSPATEEPPPGAGTDQTLRAMVERAPTCPLTSEETEGPYWFDVDYIRSDIRESRPGVPLELMLRVIDVDTCTTGGSGTPVADAVVEIWHCDALGIYSGFEDTSRKPFGGLVPEGDSGPPAPPPDGGEFPGPPGAGQTPSDGSYSVGDRQSPTGDDTTYLRGAQVTGRDGIVRFTSIFPGWYFSRTVHIHLRVHLNKTLVLTSQLYFDDALNDAVFATASPYTEHPDRDTRNDTDHIYDATGLLVQQALPDATTPTEVLAALNIGVRLN